MATRMNPLAGQYFNSPEFAGSMSNLASAFAPPSAQDAYTAARAQTERAQEARIAELFAGAAGDTDRQAVYADLYDPSNSYYSVDQSNATTRRGQDVSARTSLTNNESDNATTRRGQDIGFVGDRFNSPVTYGQAVPDIPPDVAAALGLPPMEGFTGAGIGAPQDPLTEAQVQGAMLGDARQQGLVTPQDAASAYLSEIPIEQVIMGDEVVNVRRDDAIGAEPFINRGAQAAPVLETYRTPDGRSGTATFANGAWQDTQTGEVLPAGTITGKVEDSASAFGPTTANQTEGNRAEAEMDFGLKRVGDFRTLLQANPGIVGAAGRIQGFAQDFAQASREFTGQLGDGATIKSLQEAQAIAEGVAGRNGYDPAFAQASAMALEMAYFSIKAQDPSGEVNVRELERAIDQFDGGLMGNNANVLSKLDILEQQLLDRKAIFVQGLRTPGQGSAVAAPAPAARPRATNPQTGEVIEWDGNAWVPVQ